MAASWLGGGEGNGKELGLQDVTGRKGPDQHKGCSPGTCTSVTGDRNVMGEHIHPTQALFILNAPGLPAGSREGPVVPVGRNPMALRLLPALLASSWSPKEWLTFRAGLEQNSHAGPHSPA